MSQHETVVTAEVSRAKRRGIGPALGLFFVAPLVAEFLLGNLPIKLLPALIVLAPMYGGGALLIRETVRRTGRGWPSILLMGMAYAIFEEAFTTQSLFNPNYLKLNLGLLAPAYIPSLGELTRNLETHRPFRSRVCDRCAFQNGFVGPA